MLCAAAKDTSLKPLSLVFPCRLCFPTVGPKIPSLPTFALKSPTKILTSDLLQNFEFVVKGVLGCVILILRRRMGTYEYKANVKIFCLNADGGLVFLNCSKFRDEVSESLAHCKTTPEFVPRSRATIVDITGCELSAILSCPSHSLESSNISVIISILSRSFYTLAPPLTQITTSA